MLKVQQMSNTILKTRKFHHGKEKLSKTWKMNIIEILTQKILSPRKFCVFTLKLYSI